MNRYNKTYNIHPIKLLVTAKYFPDTDRKFMISKVKLTPFEAKVAFHVSPLICFQTLSESYESLSRHLSDLWI